MKNIILFEKVFGNKRLVVTRDIYNWIIKFGSAKMNPRTFEKKAEHWYYSNLESMLICIHKKFFQFSLKSLNIDDVLKALEDAFSMVENMSQEVLKKSGVEDGCK